MSLALSGLVGTRSPDGGTGEAEDTEAQTHPGRGRRDEATTDRSVAWLRRRSVPLSVLGLALALAVSWAIAVVSGSPTSVGRHVFYVPVVLGAARFGYRGALLTGGAATLLAGPLVPGGAPVEMWLTRGAFLVAIGMIVAGLTSAAERTRTREIELAEGEQRLRDQRAALIQTVSHEFRTPLTIIRGVAETLVNHQMSLAEPFRPLASALYRAERRLSDMVGVVLAAADALDDQLERTTIEVEPLVREVAAELGSQAAQRVNVRVAPDSERLSTSPTHARLLLRCLLDNAVRFSGPGDPVDVYVRTVDGQLTITIRDQGEGVDLAFIERAFDPFTQADSTTLRRHGGLGLGLYTARQLARRLGGDVDVRPAEEGGSIAVVELPQRRVLDLTDTPR